MQFSLDQLKSAFKKDESNSSRPTNYYPFWNMEEGDQCVVRFLPDADENNPLGFMVEKLMHNLQINGENKSVPCLKMYDEDCPICKVSAAYYKENDKDSGKKYWRKKQHIVQALIVEDPLPADDSSGEKHEGKVRFLSLGYQLFNIIKEAFESGELDEVPFAYEGGCDFIIKKTKQGEYATYALGSKFARRSSDLTEDEIAFATDNMVKLSELLPPNPGMEQVEGMLQAALTGEDYTDGGTSTPSAPALATSEVRASVASEEPTPSVTTTPTASSDDYETEADDILARIRSRKAAGE